MLLPCREENNQDMSSMLKYDLQFPSLNKLLPECTNINMYLAVVLNYDQGVADQCSIMQN